MTRAFIPEEVEDHILYRGSDPMGSAQRGTRCPQNTASVCGLLVSTYSALGLQEESKHLYPVTSQSLRVSRALLSIEPLVPSMGVGID